MFSKCKYQKDGFTSACKDCNRVTKLMSNYGISVADYDSMLLLQNGKCKICGIDKNEEKNKRLMVDHCHETGKVRGLLCIKCNFLLGSAKEDINILLNTIDYLEEYQIL